MEEGHHLGRQQRIDGFQCHKTDGIMKEVSLFRREKMSKIESRK